MSPLPSALATTRVRFPVVYGEGRHHITWLQMDFWHDKSWFSWFDEVKYMIINYSSSIWRTLTLSLKDSQTFTYMYFSSFCTWHNGSIDMQIKSQKERMGSYIFSLNEILTNRNKIALLAIAVPGKLLTLERFAKEKPSARRRTLCFILEEEENARKLNGWCKSIGSWIQLHLRAAPAQLRMWKIRWENNYTAIFWP